jgi:hypothetical protein
MPNEGDDVKAAFEKFQSDNAVLADDSPFADIPVLPNDLETLTEAWLNRWAEWVAAGRPEIAKGERLTETAHLNFDPALHPRNPETGQFVERPFNSPVPPTALSDMSTKDTLAYLDSQGEDISAVLQPGSGVTVDGVPNNATTLDDIPENAESANPDIPESAIDYTIGETVPEEYRGESFSTGSSGIDELEYGDVVSVNGEAVRVLDTLGNNREFLYDDGGDSSASEGSSYRDEVKAIDTSIPGADVNDNLLGLPVPESDRGIELAEAGYAELRKNDLISVNGKRAEVVGDAESKFIEVNLGNGPETIPTVDKKIETVDTRYAFDEVGVDEIPDAGDRDTGGVSDTYGELAQQAESILQSDRSDPQTVREIEQLVDGETDITADFSEFTPAQAAETAAGISAVVDREGSVPDTLDKVEAGVPQEEKRRFNNPIAVTRRSGEDDIISVSLTKFTEENVDQLNDDGWFVSEKPRDVMIHELGHALHHTREKEGVGNGMTSSVPLDSVTQNDIEAEISDYAAENMAEFTAEAYVKRVAKGGIGETEMNLAGLLDYALGEDQ